MTVFELLEKLNKGTGIFAAGLVADGSLIPSMWVMVQGSKTATLGVGADDVASLGINADGTVRSIIMRKNARIEHLQRIKSKAPGVEIKGV